MLLKKRDSQLYVYEVILLYFWNIAQKSLTAEFRGATDLDTPLTLINFPHFVELFKITNIISYLIEKFPFECQEEREGLTYTRIYVLWTVDRISYFKQHRIIVEIFRFRVSFKARMKLFQSIQRSYAILGISSNRGRINDRMLFAAFIIGSSLILNIVSFFVETKSFREYTDATFVTSAETLCVINCTIIMCKKLRFFEFIGHFERILDQSKLRTSLLYRWILYTNSHFPRIKKGKIEDNVRRSQPTSGKVVWNRIFCNGNTVTVMHYFSKACRLIVRLFLHRFGNRGACVTIAIMVNREKFLFSQ